MSSRRSPFSPFSASLVLGDEMADWWLSTKETGGEERDENNVNVDDNNLSESSWRNPTIHYHRPTHSLCPILIMKNFVKGIIFLVNTITSSTRCFAIDGGCAIETPSAASCTK